jgi:hypothetical protein
MLKKPKINNPKIPKLSKKKKGMIKLNLNKDNSDIEIEWKGISFEEVKKFYLELTNGNNDTKKSEITKQN